MPRRTNRDADSDDHEERGRPVPDTSPRTLYWWHVPETPGVGRDLLVFTSVWFLTLTALVIVIGVIVAVTG